MKTIESKILCIDHCDSNKKEYTITAICSKRLMYLLQSCAEWEVSHYTDLSESELVYISDRGTDPIEKDYRRLYDSMVKTGERKESPSSAAFEIRIDIAYSCIGLLFIFLTSFGRSEASDLANELLNTFMNNSDIPRPNLKNIF